MGKTTKRIITKTVLPYRVSGGCAQVEYIIVIGKFAEELDSV
jgi:hypothetical protein